MLYPQTNECREMLCLDGFWQFYAEKENCVSYDNPPEKFEDLRTVAVPASWNDQYEDLFEFFGKGWYVKKEYITNLWNGKRIYIRLGSVSGTSKVWVNGNFAAEHIGTALPFEADITDFVKFGEKNTIVVLADNTLDPWGLPPATLLENEGRMGFAKSYPAVTYDFFPYGGIHRSVYIYACSKTRIEDITVKTKVENGTAKVDFNIELSGVLNGEVVIENDGQEYSYGINGSRLSAEIKIDSPRLWNVGKPNLYNARFSLFENGKKTDCYELVYGIRTVEIKENAIFVNGKKVFLKGFGKHEDFYVIGKGFSHALTVKDFALMKKIHANSFRTSHYPYDEKILDYADREGFLVIGETPFVGLNHRNFRDDVLNKALCVLKEMISRDKNHPSIIMWSLANEPCPDCDEADVFFKTLAETARKLDDTRPITYVTHMEAEDNKPIKYFDIICTNKYFGWYIYPGQIDGSLKEFSDCLDNFYNTYKKGIILTEFGADAIAGMHTAPAQMFSEEYQAEMIEKQYNLFADKPYAAGAHVWAFADFKTAQSISRVIFNRKGIFTREREPKMAAHMLEKLWNDND